MTPGPDHGEAPAQRWPAWLTDTACLRIICAGLIGVSAPVPVAVLAVAVIVVDVYRGAMGRP